MSYKNWTAKLAGEKVKTYLQPGAADEGYYRKPITEPVLGKNGKPNGQKRIIDWIPVAYFLDPHEQKLCGLIGAGENMRDMTDEEVNDETLWSWVCSHPIVYPVYQAVAERGERWPDMPPGRPVIASDNTPPVKTRQDYADEIHATVALVPERVDVKEDVESAAGIRNRLAELRLEADKAGKAVYQPLYAAYTKEQKAWAPMVAEAKGAEDKIDRLIRGWKEAERVRIAAEEEANIRAADRALIRGEEPPVPEATEAATITPDYGKRAVKAELKVFVTITDVIAVATHFKDDMELVAVLQKLAERAVKLGHEVPGITKREGYA